MAMYDPIEKKWRCSIAERCGGRDFDAPGGGYAFSEVLAEERRLMAENKPGEKSSALLTLSVADPTWKMNPVAMMAMNEYYRECPDATRYTDNAGIRAGNGTNLGDTHQELATLLGFRYPELNGRPWSADWVQYSPGAIKRALAEFIPTLFFQDNANLIFPTPGYPVIKSKMNSQGILCNDVPLVFDGSRWLIDCEQVYEQVLLKPPMNTLRMHVMYVNLPHNPTGSAYCRKGWDELLEFARRYNIILIVDEAYTDLRYDGESVSVLTVPGWEECCIVLQSASKGWNATGLRFGWMIAHPIVIKALRKVTDVKDSGMFGPSIAAGLTCLRHPEWAAETRRKYKHLHEVLYAGLEGAGFKTGMPDAGLCQCTPAPRAANGKEFANIVECAQWFRQVLRISLMHYEVQGKWYLRWAVTLKPAPECDLPTEESVLQEVARRLKEVKFEF